MDTRFPSAGGTKTDVALFPNESEALSIPTTEPLEQREGSQKQPKSSSLEFLRSRQIRVRDNKTDRVRKTETEN